MKTTRERRDSLIQWLESRGGPLRGFTITYGHLQPAIEDCNELEDRLAKLEDGVRALADQKERHAKALREEGDGEHCDGFAEALEDEVSDLRALLDD